MLTLEFYLEKILPRLRTIKVWQIAEDLQVSQPYAALIRAGRRRPHPRHWETLAKIACVSTDLWRALPPAPGEISYWSFYNGGILFLVTSIASSCHAKSSSRKP